MARKKHKMWRNDRGGKWAYRIRWFQGQDENDIRLAMEDVERSVNVFPDTKADADMAWGLFRELAPTPQEEQVPIITEVKRRLAGLDPQEDLVVRLANAADAWGLRASDVEHEPEACEQFGINPDKVTPAICVAADARNKALLDELLERVGTPATTEKKTPVPPTKKRDYIFGFSVASVLRCMGQDAWTPPETKKCLAQLQIKVSDATIRTQLWHGRKETGGKVADLTEDQKEELWDLIEKK